ncbi:uncharacterized protein C1orf131 homolog isoform X2 [Montipora foliosa]
MISSRAPKVIEFIEPGKEFKIKKRQFNYKADNKLSSQDPNGFEFSSIAREVREFGVSGFSRTEKKKYEDQKAQALGGKAPKRQKMPYPMLMRQIKKRKEQEKEQREREQAMGIFTKKPGKKKKDPNRRAFVGRWMDNSSKGLEASVGNFKAGVKCLTKADLGKMKSTKR